MDDPGYVALFPHHPRAEVRRCERDVISAAAAVRRATMTAAWHMVSRKIHGNFHAPGIEPIPEAVAYVPGWALNQLLLALNDLERARAWEKEALMKGARVGEDG